MATTAALKFKTRAECLMEFAGTYGKYPPRAPVPAWWDEFNAWFESIRHDPTYRDDKGNTAIVVRLEPSGHTDEEDDNDQSL